MKYGYFDDSKREYVITNPKTPYPWINYLGNEDFFGLIYFIVHNLTTDATTKDTKITENKITQRAILKILR